MRFSLSTLAIAVTSVACILAFVLNFQNRQDVMRLSQRLSKLEENADIQALFNSLVANLNVNDQRHRDAFWIVQSFLPTRAELLAENYRDGDSLWEQAVLETFGGKVESVALNDSGELRLLLLHRVSHRVPGNDVTVLALFDNNSYVDFVSHNSNTRIESHTVSLRDINQDAITDAEIRCVPGDWAKERENITLQYLVTPTGFELMQATGK